MRPAYSTRCWKCGIRITVSDVWRVKDKKNVFDVDAIIAAEHRCG